MATRTVVSLVLIAVVVGVLVAMAQLGDQTALLRGARLFLNRSQEDNPSEDQAKAVPSQTPVTTEALAVVEATPKPPDQGGENGLPIERRELIPAAEKTAEEPQVAGAQDVEVTAETGTGEWTLIWLAIVTVIGGAGMVTAKYY